MELQIIGDDFCVCKVRDISQVDFNDKYVFLAKTDEEISLVCKKDNVPGNALIASERYTALRFKGMLDFSLIGILAKAADILAKEKISIFAISTYNTDYILVNTNEKDAAIKALKANGYKISI